MFQTAATADIALQPRWEVFDGVALSTRPLPTPGRAHQRPPRRFAVVLSIIFAKVREQLREHIPI
jgi:hypothetical protein